MGFETATYQWDAGLRRLEDEGGWRREVLEAVVGAIVEELRRRLGGAFTIDELTAYYDREGTDWATEIAARVAPEDPFAWDAATVADAAFARYLRGATDYAGGRRAFDSGRS